MKQYSITQKIRFRPLTDFKTIYRKLQYRENVFGEFEALSRFPRKIVLYLSTKLGIPKSWTNILWPRILDFGLWHTSKQSFKQLQFLLNFWRVQRFALFSQKNVFVFVNQISHSKVLNQYSMAKKVRFRLLTHFKTSL